MLVLGLAGAPLFTGPLVGVGGAARTQPQQPARRLARHAAFDGGRLERRLGLRAQIDAMMHCSNPLAM
ncbi:hypothetical protein D3C77_726260 [compost metagenome]